MSSLFGALATSVSGLEAQSAAFGNISDNVANSQTTGFKRTDTDFVDYLTYSTAVTNDSGFVAARPDYQNEVQRAIAASNNPLALAISGQGFFQVNQSTGNTTTGLSPTTEYSRNGNFTLDNNGYLLNDAGQVLDGWAADPTTGAVNQSQIAPIKISQQPLSPVATSSVTLAANLPATPAAATPVASQINVYDAKGSQHTINLAWTQNASDDWTVTATAADATTTALGSAEVKFGAASGNGVADGTIGSLSNTTGGVTGTAYAANGAATLSLSANFGSGAQAIQLNLGNYGGTNGVTQYAGTSYNLVGLTQNGTAPGAFKDVTTAASGDITVNYDNGQSRVVARVPVVQFANADALQRENGEAFTATTASGTALAQNAGTDEQGMLVTNSLEGSNTDIAAEFTKLIVAQRAYSANAKMVTTADDMLQQTLDMKR